METLAVSMIVRDEPVDRLVLLIDFLRPLWTQFIIADTGSKDYEIDAPLLRAAGADIFQIEWRDDFAWARNQTLDRIGADWVLHLDGDEIPSLQMIRYIEGLLAADDKSKHAALFFTRNYWGGSLGDEATYHWHIRMFRHGSGYWYRPVHELVNVCGATDGSARGDAMTYKAPKDAYLIHSKPAERIAASTELYTKLGEVSW